MMMLAEKSEGEEGGKKTDWFLLKGPWWADNWSNLHNIRPIKTSHSKIITITLIVALEERSRLCQSQEDSFSDK